MSSMPARSQSPGVSVSEYWSPVYHHIGSTCVQPRSYNMDLSSRLVLISRSDFIYALPSVTYGAFRLSESYYIGRR